MKKLTLERIKEIKEEREKLYNEIRELQKQMIEKDAEREYLLSCACDADCENDGNVHREGCSVYKV